MQQELFNEPLYEYCLLVGPDPQTVEAVKALKQLLHDRIVLSWANLNSQPHVSLFEFRETESAEPTMIRNMTAVLKDYKAFPVVLDGIQVFEHGQAGKSLVLDISNPKPVREIQALLRRALHLKRQQIVPHLTIARKVPAKNFSKLESLEDFDYKGEFLCDHITLLKKPADSTKSYTVLHEIRLPKDAG